MQKILVVEQFNQRVLNKGIKYIPEPRFVWHFSQNGEIGEDGDYYVISHGPLEELEAISLIKAYCQDLFSIEQVWDEFDDDEKQKFLENSTLRLFEESDKGDYSSIRLTLKNGSRYEVVAPKLTS